MLKWIASQSGTLRDRRTPWAAAFVRAGSSNAERLSISRHYLFQAGTNVIAAESNRP